MNDRLKDFFEVIGKACKSSFAKINKAYIVFIVILIRAFYQNYKVTGIFSRTIAGGLIDYFIDAILLCFVAQGLKSLVVYGNPGKKSIGNSLNNFLQPILSTMFYVYLIEVLFSIVQVGLSFVFYLIFTVAFKFFMYAMLEEVYINGKQGYDALSSSAKFVCDNILTYGILSLIFVLMEVYFTYNFTYGLALGFRKVMYVLIYAVFELFFYLFRGHLFKYLNDHPYRQRKFMRY